MKTGEKVHQEPKTGEIVHENRRKSTSKKLKTGEAGT